MPTYRLDIRPVRTVSGTLVVPGDKSISHRYVMLGAMARGVTMATHVAPGADVAATIACLRTLGARIDVAGPDAIRVSGLGRRGLRPGS